MKQQWIDLLRIVLVLIGAFSQIIMGGLPFSMGWENTIASRSNEVQTLVIPADYAFIIWNFLFLGCLIFAFMHALPKYRTDPMFKKVGWLAAIAFFFNTLWEAYVPLFSFDIVSLLIILVIFIAVLSAMFLLRDAKDHRWMFIPLMLLAGWISVATFVNISVTTNFLVFNPFEITPQAQAMIVIAAAGIVTSLIAFYFGSLFYNFCTLWGLVAIYFINTAREEFTIAYLALILGVAGFIIALLRRLNLLNKIDV